MAITHFEKGDKISRAEINRRFDQMEATFGPTSRGGTGGNTPASAVNNLGGYTRVTVYDNWAGSSSEIYLNLPSRYGLYNLGIYYGINYIKRYIEFSVYSGGTVEETVSMRYLTGSGNLVIRSMLLSYYSRRLSMFNHRSDFFEPNGGYRHTENEPMLIYKVVAFYSGRKN